MKFDAVFFDLDGTLVNSLDDLANSVNYVLSQKGFPNHSTDAFKYFAGDGIAKMIERALPPDNRYDEAISELKGLFMERYKNHCVEYTVPYDGLVSLVSCLKEKGIKIAVVTNKAQEMAEKIVYALYGDVFDCILGLRDGVPPKPDPTGIFMALKQLKVTPEKCAFVGDSGMDIAGSVNSGTYPIGVLWGFREKEELTKFGARELVSNADELMEILLRE